MHAESIIAMIYQRDRRDALTEFGDGGINMNHLEQLVAEWLQYNRYFVRVSVHVGPRERGGFEGELDVVGINLVSQHLLHVECSLDAAKGSVRQDRFAKKFECGRRFIKNVFEGMAIPTQLEQVLVQGAPSRRVQEIGGARVVTVRELIHEIYAGLEGTTPLSKAVPSTLPLLRTLQFAADATRGQPGDRLLR